MRNLSDGEQLQWQSGCLRPLRIQHTRSAAPATRTFADTKAHPFAATAVSAIRAASGVLCHSRVLGRRVVRALLAPPDQG